MTEELLSGNWWLVRAEYPVACDASITEVIESDEDPLDDVDYVHELIEECVNSYGYLNDFYYDEDLDDSEEEQYDQWYSDQCEGIELNSEKITQKTIDKYGFEWLTSRINGRLY